MSNSLMCTTRLVAPLLLSISLAGCSSVEATDEAAAVETEEAHPVVLLELFTSQGCSSCPPADRLLSRLAEEEGVAALSFHVDYWNYIGWTDPFSAEAWTHRQHAYAWALQADTVYTPQLVIDGRAHVVGSRPDTVQDALAEARRRAPVARLEITDVRIEGDTLHATVSAELLRPTPAPCRILVALVQDGLVTPVSAGENRRATLKNDRVVRRLETVATLGSSVGASEKAEVAFPLGPDWLRQDLGLVAFVQSEDSLEVYGATKL